MKKWVLILLAMWGLASWAAEAKWNHGFQPGCDPNLKREYLQLVGGAPAHGRKVSGLDLKRPAFRLHLESGILAQEDAAYPGGGHGYAFAGAAAVDFSVSDPIEKAHFKRFTGAEAWTGQPVETVFILATGPADPFEGPFGEALTPPFAWEDLKNAFHWSGFDTLAALYNRANRNRDDILVLFQVGQSVWCYCEDSENDEEISLLRLGRPPEREARWWDPVVSQHLNADGSLGSAVTQAEAASKIRLDLRNVKTEMAVEGSGQITATAGLDLAPLKASQALLLNLSPRLGVKSVKTAQGAALPFLQTDFSKAHEIEEEGLLVTLPEGTPFPGTVVVEYAGELFEANADGWLMSKEEDLWHPAVQDLDGSGYDTTLTVPDKFEAITIGELVDRTASGGKATYHYRFSDKTFASSLAIGKFRHSKEDAAGIAVDVAFPDSVYTAKNKDDEKSIRVVVSNCIKIYQKLYGPQKFNRLTVAECAGGHGRGFPTLLLLSALWDPTVAQWFGVNATLDQGLVAHEAGHQWWGNIVEPLTYRDTWISEGMAELASFDYAMVVHGPKKVKDVLEAVEYNLDSLLAYSREASWKEGPVLLGTRLATTLEPRGAYQTIVYDKAAWAMVNLRKMALAVPPGGSIQPFYDALQDFLRTYGGHKASTLDFQRVLERHYRMKLDWFFDQYFRRDEIPTVSVKARTEQIGGQWKLVVEGTQDTDFRLYIPIQLTYGDQTREVLFLLEGRQGRQEIPLEGKPSSVKVDPLNETLARVKS